MDTLRQELGLVAGEKHALEVKQAELINMKDMLNAKYAQVEELEAAQAHKAAEVAAVKGKVSRAQHFVELGVNPLLCIAALYGKYMKGARASEPPTVRDRSAAHSVVKVI